MDHIYLQLLPLFGMTAMSLQSMSGGCFRLGLGTSGPQVVEGWHGVPFAGAVSRLVETAQIVRKVCNGERLVHEGRHYTLPLPGGEGKAIRSGSPPCQPPPIYLASLGPRSLELCGEVADGWLGTSFIPEIADIFFDDIDLEVAAGVVFADDVERTTKQHARGITFTLGAMGSAKTSFYNDAFCRQGWPTPPKKFNASGSKATATPPASPLNSPSKSTASATSKTSKTASASTSTPASTPSAPASKAKQSATA